MCYNTDMQITYKYRLFPTSAQRTSLKETLELCRLVYNDTLAIRKETYKQTGKGLSLYDTNKLLTSWKTDRPVLARVHSQVLQNVQVRVDLAFQAFFRRVKAGETPGYPRFKGKGYYDSFTYTQSGFILDGERLVLSKIGNVKIKIHRPIVGIVKTMTIQRDTIDNFYACFSCIVEPILFSPTSEVVGIDLGLTTLAYLSNGEKIERQRWMKIDANDIARLQRKKEKFTKGSPERKKVLRALSHAYQRSVNRRNNFSHQESRKLVNRYQFIAFEKLDIRGMQANGNKTINRGIVDVAWGQLVQNTLYKAANAGRVVALVNPRGTTQECSGCHNIVPKDLSVRIHDCPHCGLKLNRDHNAALNILARGLAGISTGSPDVAIKTHRL